MQKIEDFKFGMLYRCTDLRALAPWAQRLSDGGGHEQNYNQFLLHRDRESGELFLIDTYHIRSVYMKDNSYQWFLDESVDLRDSHPAMIRERMRNCYYNASVPLNADNAHLFEEFLYLPDWRFAKGDASEYSPDDVAQGVKLWWECCYSQGGACLIRKDAKVDSACQVGKRVRDVLRDMTSPHAGTFSMTKLREFLDELPEDADYDRIQVEELEARYEKLAAMEGEWKAFCADLQEAISSKRAATDT